MDEITPELLARKRMTTRLIIEEAMARGWKAWSYTPESSLVTLRRRDGKTLTIYSSMPPTTSAVSLKLSDNKFYTYSHLREAGFPVLETTIVAPDTEEKVIRSSVEALLAGGHTCVVKPIDAAHGNGVSVNLDSFEVVARGLEIARQFSDTCILQQYYEPSIDVRLTCINFRVVTALVRLPARVQGDGASTIEQLIEQENASDRRGSDYAKDLNKIDLQAARYYLGNTIQTIPGEGEWVRVVGAANVGSGGELVEVPEKIPQWLESMAEEAARTCGLYTCGVDFLLKTWPTPEANQEELQPVIIELNRCPALLRPAVKKYIDYLETL